jgi:putative NADPH-quinone reductase
MHTVLFFDHPYGPDAWDNTPHHRSLSAAILHEAVEATLVAGHTVDVIDPRADGFDPVMSADELAAWRRDEVLDPLVRAYQERVRRANHLVLVFPVWWEAMPAATKGFLDKVVTPGFAYAKPDKPGRFRSLLPDLQTVTLCTVMTTPMFWYKRWFRQPAPSIVLRGVFEKISVKDVSWISLDGGDRSADKRRGDLERARRHFERIAARAGRPAPEAAALPGGGARHDG